MKIPVFKTSITEVDKEYAREQTECPFINDLDGISFVDKSGCLCVWFNGEPALDTIVHESVHLANMIIDRTDMMYSTKEDELLAYLVAYIFNELRRKNEMEKGVQQMNRDCEIGSLGKYVVTMSLADLKEIANGELRAYSEELEYENSALQYKLEKAKEALKFYAEQEHYLDHCRDYSEYDNADWIEGNVENGQKARETLEEIGECQKQNG